MSSPSSAEAACNKDELEAPAWMDAAFFTEVLRSCEADATIAVRDLKLAPAAPLGDHYASIMFRATMTYEGQNQEGERSRSMVIKTMPELEGRKKEMLQESAIFETEIAMYTKVIPRFEAVLRSVGDDAVLGPRCVYHGLSPRKFIVLEDVVPLGYAVQRDRQADMEEARAAYLKLAKWHAISYKIAHEDPGFFEQFQYSLFHLPNIENSKFVVGGCECFVEMLETQPALRQFKPRFEAMARDLMAKCRASSREYREQRRPDSIYVLCHGDFHLRNMMFKRDPASGRLQDVMLLDFQLCSVGPMVLDLIYSFYLLLDVDLRSRRRDELLDYFFDGFVATLRRIGFEGRLPTAPELRRELMQHRHYEIFLVVTFLPMLYDIRKKAKELDELADFAAARMQMYLQDEYLAEMHECLPRFLRLGLLEP